MKKQAANGDVNSITNTSTSSPFLLPDTSVDVPSVQEKREEEPKTSKVSITSKSTVKPKVTIPKTSVPTSSTSTAPKRRRIGLSRSELTGKSTATVEPRSEEQEDISLDEVPLTMHKKKNEVPQKDPEVQKKKPLVRTHISW